MRTLKHKYTERDNTAEAAEQAANKGHYLERLENIAIVIGDRESQMAVQALRSLYVFAGCRPKGSDGIQYEISVRLLIRCERDHKFTKAQLSRLWYGVHWDAHEMFGLKFPYGDTNTNEMRSNMLKIRGAV